MRVGSLVDNSSGHDKPFVKVLSVVRIFDLLCVKMSMCAFTKEKSEVDHLHSS